MPVDAKRTKRIRDESEGLSLEDHIAAKRAALVAARGEAGMLRRRACELRDQAASYTRRWEVRLAKDLVTRAESLEEEARVRESMQREHDFETTVVSYLRMYHQEAAVPTTARKSETIKAYVKQADHTTQRRAALVDEYLTQMEKAPAKVAMAARDECPRCDVPHKLRLCAHKSIMTCPSCGYALSYLDATSSSTSFDEVVEYSQYSYKRVNHYMMWLSLVQGKEAHRVPEDILRAVAVDLHDRQRVRTVEEITQKRVRASLRKLRLRKAYDHVAQVTARLSGRRPPQLSREVEEQLRNMFLQMQPVFQKHAPSSRTNFLSYSYVLYRCFQILGRHDMLEGITLLKGRDKLEANDLIFRNMCEDLGWPVYELPPASETTGG